MAEEMDEAEAQKQVKLKILQSTLDKMEKSFGKGAIMKPNEIIDMGVELDIIHKSGSWFSYSDAKPALGREALKRLLRDNPELRDELEQKIRAAQKENAV